MNLPDMFSVMLGVPIIVDWLIHFMIGRIFTMAYTFFFINLVKKISNVIFRGAIFGCRIDLCPNYVGNTGSHNEGNTSNGRKHSVNYDGKYNRSYYF